jgi:hypothetical protein
MSGLQGINVKRLPLLLLLIGVIFGLIVQLPEPVFAAQVHAEPAVEMAQNSMASMPDCKSAMPRKSSSAPCKCGTVGCLAMTSSGATMLLADAPALADASVAAKLAPPVSPVAHLRGRSTVPEPEPPSLLV